MSVPYFNISDYNIVEDPVNYSLSEAVRGPNSYVVRKYMISPDEIDDYKSLQTYNFPSICSCCGVCIQQPKADQWMAWLRFPFKSVVPLSSLLDVLSRSEIHIMAFGVAKGLAFLHERGIVHGDLTPDEIWLKHRMEPLIAGFPLSRRARSLRRGKSASDDVSSFGLILWGMLIQRMPKGSVRIPRGAYQQLILQCLRQDQDKRMTAARAAEFLKNPLFRAVVGIEGTSAFREYVYQFGEELDAEWTMDSQ
jgi:serine/threonine protein kinase